MTEHEPRKLAVRDLAVFPVVIGRSVETTYDEISETVPEHIGISFQATFDHDQMPEPAPFGQGGGSVSATVSCVGSFREWQLGSLERLADGLLADALEAIAAELRRRAG